MRPAEARTYAELSALDVKTPAVSNKHINRIFEALPEYVRVPIDAYLAEEMAAEDQERLSEEERRRHNHPRRISRPPDPEKEELRRAWRLTFRRAYFLMDLEKRGLDAAPAILRERRERDAESKAQAAARREREAVERAGREARWAVERAERDKVRGAAVKDLLERGIPIPKELRPPRTWKGERCLNCTTPLTDPESIRLGIGPDCLARLRRGAAPRTDAARLRLAAAGHEMDAKGGTR